MATQLRAREISVGDVLSSGHTVSAVQASARTAHFYVISTDPEPRYTSDGYLRGRTYKAGEWVKLSPAGV